MGAEKQEKAAFLIFSAPIFLPVDDAKADKRDQTENCCGDCEAGSKTLMDQTIKPPPTPASKPRSLPCIRSCWPSRPSRACEPFYSPACGSSRVRPGRPPRARPDGAAS